MLSDDIALLRESRVVSRIISETADEDSQKVRVELSNGWLMECWERMAQRRRRYSFHIFQEGQLITRWDNSLHHRGRVNTFPFHRHRSDGSIVDSEDMDTAKVLAYLETRIQSP